MFELYGEEVNTLPFSDYGTIINTVKAVGAKSALEFGPGYSTLALIESGLERIVSAECHKGYRDLMRETFKPYKQVHVVPYADTRPLKVGVTDDAQFDIAFVDSPRGKRDFSRLNTLLFAVEHAPVVMLHDAWRLGERMSLDYVAGLGHHVKELPDAHMALVVRSERCR